MRKKAYPIFMLILTIVTSLFIMIAPTLFTKDISRVTLNKKIDLPLILDDEKEIKLIFFGYSGCADICTPRLYGINEIYKSLDTDIKKKVGVEFVDISTPYDSTLPERFASFFNKEFKGIYLDTKVLRNYTKEFGVYFSPGLIDKTGFNHTSNLYLAKKSNNNKVIKYVYTSYPYDFKQIKSDIKELLHE